MTVQPAKQNWWYDSFIDWMLKNPDKTIKQAAAEFDVTPQWLYVLKNSDVFKRALEERRAKHSDMISTSVIEKVGALADMAVDHLIDKFAEAEVEGKPLPIKFVKDTAEFALEKLGYTGKTPSAPMVPAQVAVQVNVVSPELLAEARARLRQTQLEQPALQPAPVPLAPDGPLLELIAVEDGGAANVGGEDQDDTALCRPEVCLADVF